MDGPSQTRGTQVSAAADLPVANGTTLPCLGGSYTYLFLLLDESGVLHFSGILSDPAADCSEAGKRRRVGFAPLASVEFGRTDGNLHRNLDRTGGRAVELSPLAICGRHRHGARQAKPAGRNAFDGAHARPDRRIIRSAPAPGHPGRSNPSDRSRCCFLASSPWIAIRSDLDDGRHHGCLPDRCAYRSGALRSVSRIAKHGSTNCTGAAAKRSRDDLRRSIVWLVVTFLFGPPH